MSTHTPATLRGDRIRYEQRVLARAADVGEPVTEDVAAARRIGDPLKREVELERHGFARRVETIRDAEQRRADQQAAIAQMTPDELASLVQRGAG